MRALPLTAVRNPNGTENEERRYHGMKRNRSTTFLLALAAALLLAGCWGSTKDRSIDLTTVPEPAQVGSQNCFVCHGGGLRGNARGRQPRQIQGR